MKKLNGRIGLCLLACAFGSLVLAGCGGEPAPDRSEFGQTVNQLPDLPDRPESFTLPDGVEEKDCPVAQGHSH